jgi:hypothetical protein
MKGFRSRTSLQKVSDAALSSAALSPKLAKFSPRALRRYLVDGSGPSSLIAVMARAAVATAGNGNSGRTRLRQMRCRSDFVGAAQGLAHGI